MTFGVNFAAIFDAFQRFVNAPFQEKRGILEHEQHLLLINSADILVTAHIEKKRNSADQNERELADALDAYRDVLRRSRKRGIASAWAKFEATYSTVKHRPLEKEQQHRFIHNEKRKFDDMISEAEHRGHSEESGLSNQLKTMRDLLQQAQEVGIIAAWEELEAWKNVVAQIEQQASYLEVREAILSLVTASPQQIREIFEQKQHLLLVDGSVELINLLTQEAQQKDETDIANQLANIGRLVQQAHEVGIAPILQALDTMDISFVKHIPPSILPTLFAAVGDFIHAHGADEIRSVIEHHRDLLLNDDAESVLRQYIKDAKRQNQDQSLIELFERSLIVLRTIRHAGLEAAMALLNATAHSNDIVTEMGPTDAAPQDIQATILQWGSIRNYREQRRFLEAHLELLDAGLEAHLQIMFERDRMHEEVLREEEKWISPTDAQVMQMIRERITLIRDIRSRGGTIQAIRDRYINAFTGFALDLPDWLEPIEEQYQLLVERDDSSEKLSPVIQQMLVDLFRPALARAQQEASLAPEILAEIYTRLGQSLSSIDSIHQNEAIEEAIPYLEAALAVYTAEQYPQCWAHGQYCLAGAYFSRISNDRQDNLERARRASESALLFITREIDPSIWAELQQNLGTIYQERNSGDLDENLERSIEYYNASLTVFVRDTYPLAWAQTQSSLGGVYHKRAKGRKKEDQQLAVTYHEAALEIFTREQFPLQWAQIWSNLNILLHEKVSDNPSKEEDLQSIIAKEKEVLEVFSREHFPKRWANTQNNLGALFADLATGDPDTVLAQAFQHWEAALQVRTRAAFPLEFQHTHLNMAQTAHWIIANRALEQGNEQAVRDAYALAHQHYLLAREVQADFGWLTTNPQARAILQGSVNDMYLRDAWCLVQIGDLLGAIVALEAGRAQALAEAQAIAGTQLDGVCEVHRDQFMTVRQELQSANTSDDRLIMRSARDTFLQVRQDIRRHCQPVFLPSEPTYAEIAAAAAPDQALVYLATMDRGGVALVIPPAQEQADAQAREPFAILLPHLTRDTSIEWLEKVDKGKGKLGGFRFGLEFRGARLIAHWFSQATSDEERERWLAVPLQDFLQVLPSSMSTLREAVARMLRSWRAEAERLLPGDAEQQLEAQDILQRLRTPLGQVDTFASVLTNTLGWFVLEVELEEVLQRVSEKCMKEMRGQLDQHGLGHPEQRIALIPYGRLGVLPLHAAIVRNDSETGNEIPFLDTCELSYQASARSLATANSLLANLPLNGPVLAVGNPQPTRASKLVYAEAEALRIHALARHWGRQENRLLVAEKATLENIKEALLLARQQHSGAWLHIASHGHADANNPANCYMLLSQNKKLSLSDLQREYSLTGLRGFNASGCVTGLGDIITAPDELSSFAAGILQAGSPCALVTLWSVDDRAHCLLMLQYMQEMLQNPASSPARALRAAVRWLRHATPKDLLRELRKLEVGGLQEEGGLTRAALRGIDLQESESVREGDTLTESVTPFKPGQFGQDTTQAVFPYSHPVYWAATIFYGV